MQINRIAVTHSCLESSTTPHKIVTHSSSTDGNDSFIMKGYLQQEQITTNKNYDCEAWQKESKKTNECFDQRSLSTKNKTEMSHSQLRKHK